MEICFESLACAHHFRVGATAAFESKMSKIPSFRTPTTGLVASTLLASITLLGAAPASAQLYTGANYAGNKFESHQLSIDGKSGTYSVGAISVSTSSTLSNPFYVYCIDPLDYASLPSNYTTTSLSNFVNTTTAGSNSYTTLFKSAPYTQPNTTTPDYGLQNTTTVFNNLTTLYSHAYAESLKTNAKSAAFQFAVWSILGESSNYYGSTVGGLFSNNSADTAFRAQADAYLTAVTSSNWSNVNGSNLTATTTYNYTVYASSPLGGSQTFLGVTPGNANSSNGTVPEPGSLALVAIAGVAGIGMRRRNARR